MPFNLGDNVERFVAFAFAAAEMVVEADEQGNITYAAGAFRSKFGDPGEAHLGQPICNIITPADRSAVSAAMLLLASSGRLLPMLVHLADTKQTLMAFAGLALPIENGARRLCLTFARPPRPNASVRYNGTAIEFTRTMEARLRTDQASSLGLVEVVGQRELGSASVDALGEALEITAPGAVASEIAPGRFGVLSAPGKELDLAAVVHQLEEMLHDQGIDVAVKAHDIPLATEGLSPSQVARALRQALSVFAREGTAGLAPAGLSSGLAASIRRAAKKVDSLRRAIRNGRFTMVYQPIVALADRRIHHYEALIRPHPVDGCTFANPQEFVTLVEALGLADELDMAVAAVTCEAAARSGLRIAFNISSQSVQSSAFRDQLIHLLSESVACKAGLILVEMTETAELDNLEEARLTANALRALNVPFCLDDFGAGAVDIRLLRSLPADIVKLDGSYVEGIAEAGRERAFLAGMIEIARAAGVEIAAEKVEKEAEAQALMKLGVRYGQGWLFGRPVPLPGPQRA